MIEARLPTYVYTNKLGEYSFQDFPVLLDEDDFKKLEAGADIEDLDYGLSGDAIYNCEKEIAKRYFLENYRLGLRGKFAPNAEQIQAIQHFMGINRSEFSAVLGVDKGSFTNILKREKISRPVALLILERLGMELVQPGSIKALIHGEAPKTKPDIKMSKELNTARFAAA